MARAYFQPNVSDERDDLGMSSMRKNQLNECINEYVTDHVAKKVYKKGKLLGIGGFARVYEMTDLATMETFAGKIIHKSRLVRKEQREKMMKEIHIHRHMRHQNIVKFHNYFEDKENLYIILELCPRKSLFQVLRCKQRLDEEEVRFFMMQLAEGVRYIHEERSIVHRDLKLGNLLLSKDLNLKIADFGLATRLKNEQTLIMTVCGTPNYIAPEVLSMEGYGFPADVWAMGCILYALLVGQPPFESSTLKETYSRINNSSYSMPKFISSSARHLISTMLQQRPEERPTASQLLEHDFFTGVNLPNAAALHNSIIQWEKFSTNRSASIGFKRVVKLKQMNRSLPALHLNFHAENNHKNEISEIKIISIDETSLPKVKLNLRQRIAKMLIKPKEKSNHLQLARVHRKLALYLKEHNPTETNGSTSKPMSDNFIFVSKWMDFSNKHGFGYLLSDGAVGVIFNDGSLMKVSPDNRFFEFISKSNEVTRASRKMASDNYESQLNLLDHFAEYMEENLVEGATLNRPTKWKKNRSVHLCHWYRTVRAILLILSNGTVQVNFADHTKIVISDQRKGKILFIDRDKRLYFYSFRDIRKRGCQQNVHSRLRHAANTLQAFIENEL